MKLVFYDDAKIILFLNHFTSYVDFEDRELLETYFKELFQRLKDFYHIVIQGYYKIDIYIDKIYGTIIEIEKEEIEYFEYDDSQVDMQICIHETSIVYELEEYIPLEKELYDTIWYCDKWYVRPKEKLSEMQLGRLLEYALIHYQEEIDQIIKKGIYIKGY